MKKHEAEKLIAVIRELAEDGVGRPEPAKANLDRPHQPYNAEQKAEIARIGAAAATSNPAPADVDFEVLYQKIYSRAKRQLLGELRVDPIFVQLLASQPEIVVEIEPRRITIDGASLKGRIARLMSLGWFKDPRKSGAVRTELSRTGSDPGSGGRLSEALTEYVNLGFLTREGDAYVLAPGVKISEKVLEVV